MGKSKNKLLIILMVAVLAVTACGLLLSACAEEPVKVVLDANGGTFTGGGTTLEIGNLQPGGTLDLSLYAPTRSGYTLTQWTDSNQNVTMAGASYRVPLTARPGSTVRLTAQWTSDSGDGITGTDIFREIIGGLTNGDNLHSEYSTTLTVPDGDGGTIEYSIQYASNVKRGIINQGEYDYDLGLVIRNETENKGVAGIYITDEYGVPGGLYIDTNPDDETGSVFLLEDFNSDYLLALVEKLPTALPDAISGLLGGLSIDIFDVIFSTALQATGEITVDGNGNNVYTLSFNPTALLTLSDLLSALVGGFGIDLNPLFSYLGDVIPDSTFVLSAVKDSSGNLLSLGSSFTNHETGEVLYEIDGGTITCTDRNEDTLSLIPSKVQNYANTYSLGHIQLSAGVTLDTLDAAGGQVDIAALINTFVPGTLPEGVLMLDADLAYRLDLAIDLDIAQKPYSEGESEGNVKDESVIAIEIKDTKNNDKVIAGIYYKEGYLYVNIGQIVGGLTGSADVWNGKGFAIPFDLPSLITAIKDVAVDAIDGFFGTDHGMITGETDLTKAEGAVVGLSLAQDGNVYISQDWGNLFITIFQVLKIEGASNWVNITQGEDYDSLDITIDKALIDSVLTAISGFGVDTSAIQIPDFGTGTISFKSGSDGLRDISVGLALKGLNLDIKFDTLELLKPIEKGDTSFAEYVDEVLGDKSQYTSNLNDLVVSTLSSGLKGSIGLDISFNQGTYNLGDLLAIFGLDLGDLKIEVEQNAKLDLSLKAGLYIDETDYANSAMYLQLYANNAFSLGNTGNIIDEGVILGVYLQDNEVILDASGLTILGIDLPVYKIKPKDFDMAALIGSLLAMIPDSDLAIDLSGVIASLTPAEQAAAAALAGNGNVIRSSTRVNNNDLINLTVNNNLLQATATLTGVLSLLSSLGLNIDFDASQFLQGEALIDIKLEDGALTAQVTGDLLTPEEGGSSGLNATLTLDLADEWQIGGGVKTNIDSTITAALAQADWEDADDALLNGLLDQLFNSTLTLAVTLPDADTGIANLIGEVIGLIPNVDPNIKTMLESIDLGIGTEEATIALAIELYKQGTKQIIKLGINYAGEAVAEILLNEQDDLYINLGYFGLGKYVVTDSGLYTMLTDLLATLSEDLSLGSLLGGLVDFSGNIAFKAYTVGEDVMLMWNKYGAASSVYYKVYSGNSDAGTLLFDTGAEQATGFTFNETTGIYTAQVDAASEYFIQVYTKLAQVQGQSAVTEQVLFDALAAPDAYQAAPASAGYQTIDAVTFTWQASNPFGAAETYQLVDAGGNAVSDLAGATYDASTFTYTAVVDLTDKTGPYTIRVNGVDVYTNIVPQQGAVTVAGIEMSLSESTYTLTWMSVDGASRYDVTMTDSAGAQLWTSSVADGGTRYSNIMWGAQYANYTLTVEAYDQNGELIATGSVSSSASGGIMDTVTTLLSALSIKGNLISLNVTRDILSELIASLTGGATITLVDAAITELDIFQGSANLSIGVYEDASVDDGEGYTITGRLTLAPTKGVPAVSTSTSDYSDYKEINLLYGAGLVESVTSILAGGLSVEAELNISLERGDYNVAEIIGPFLPDNIAEYLGDEFIWKVGETGTTEIALNLGVYAALNEDDVNNSGFMVQLSFPNGVSLSGTGEDGVVAGNGFVIKKGAAITIAVSKNTLVVDLSAITILGITLPVYKVDNFKMGEFVEGYLVQLERTVANMYNDGNGMLYLPDKSYVTVRADKEEVDFEIAFDYIGDDMKFDVVYGTKGGETAIIGATVTYNEATTTHTAKGTYSVVAAEGDYIAVYAKDTNGNRYDCLKLTATKSGESIVFTVPEVAAQSLATTGLTYDNYLTIDSSKLQLVITSQTIFSLLSLVADIPSSISSMDFDVTVGLGEQDTASDEKSIWVVADGTLGGKQVKLSLDAGIGLGGKIGEQTIAEYIADYIDEYDNEQSADENDYPTKLIAGILDEVLTSTVTLSITADAAAEQGFDLLGVAKQLVGGLINFGDTTLDLVAEQNKAPVSIDLVLALDGAMNGANVDLNMISLKLNYVTTDKTITLLGIYVQGGKLWLDLSGIGMGAVQVDASDIIKKLTSYLGGLIDGIDIDLAGILDMIAAGGTYPYGQPVPQSLAEGDTAAGDTSTGVSEETANVIKALITLVSVENANIKLDVTRNIINELLSLVDAVSMSLNASAGGYLDIFAGKAEIVATVYDSSAGSGDSGKLTLTLGLGISATPAAAAEELAKRISSLTAVELDLGNMDVSVANLLNSLSASLNLKVTTADKTATDETPTTNLWALLGPILDSVLVLDNQNVINALEAIKANGVNWTIDPTSIDLSLALASDIKLTGEEGSKVIDTKNSTIVVGIIANKPLVLGSATDNTPMLNEREGIYLTIYGGSLYIDLSQLKLLDIQLPVLKVGTFEVMDYIAEVADIIQGGIDDMLGGLDDLTQTQSLAAVMALANGTQTENAKLELGSDLTLSVALSAITQILKDTSIIDLTALDLPWEIVLTTATDGAGQLQLQLNNTEYDTTPDPEGVNLEASLTLAAAFKERTEGDDTDLRNALLAYVNGTGENDTVADRFADKSGDLIGEVINSVLSSRLTLELGASSNGDTFDINYALNGILKLLDMEEGIDPDLAFNLDTSAGVKYRLNLTLDGDSSDLSAINAYIGIEMASGDGITEASWETAIGIYVTGGEIYLDLRAIRNGALGGGVLKVTNSAIMDLFETELNKLLGNINLDLNELLTLSYTPIQQGGDVEQVSTAPSLTVNEMPVGTLVSYLIQMVSLQNLGVALNAHTALLKALTSELFGTAIDFVEADGSLLLVDGKLNLNVKVGDAAFADGEEVTTDPTNVYTLAAVLDISRATDIIGKIEDVKEEPATELDLSNGATLADSLMGLLGNLSLDLNVDISLPGGVFGIGDLLNSFGLVQGGLTDANGLDLIFEPLYKDETNTTAEGGMKLGLTLSLRLALDAKKPANSLGELKLSFNENMVMGIGEDGQDKVLFEAGTNFLTVIIDGTNLYVDLSDITLLGITMPKYHTANFDIATFVDYVLGKALDNTESVIYGDHGKTETGGESGEQGEGDVTTVNLAEKDDQGNWTSLSENEAMFIGVTENDIVAMVSFTAVEAFLKLFGLNADLSNYDANIDLTISRNPANEAWMQLHFVGKLDSDMYYDGAATEGTISITNVELGGTPTWTDEVRDDADEIKKGAQDAGSMLIQGIIDQILNLNATLNVSLEEGSDTYISLASVLGYIFDQTGIDVDLSEIMLDLAGLNVAVKINLDIDSESRDNSAATIEIEDSGNNIKLIGIYLKGQDLVIDLSGISLGRFAVTQSAIPDLVYNIVFDLIDQIKKIDIDLDTIVDSLYDLVNEAFKPAEEGAVEGQNLAVPELNVTPGVALSGNGFALMENGQYVTVTDNGDGTTTLSWSVYPSATVYMLQLYNGYDNSKTNLLKGALAEDEDFVYTATEDGMFVVNSRVTSVTVSTEALNNVGWLADATSKYNGAEFPSYYVFVVRAGRSFNADTNTFTPITLGGQDVYASATNYTLLKTILGMVKIRNGAIEVDARAVMVDKLLRGVLGVSFDWAEANVNIDIVEGSASIGLDLSDGDPEQYLATEATALPTPGENTLTYSWNLTDEQVANIKDYSFVLRERAGDTATFGKIIERSYLADTEEDGVTWIVPNETSNTLTVVIDTTFADFAWLNAAHRANADGDTTTNLEMALNGKLPLRVTGYYDVNTVRLAGTLQLGANGEEGANAALNGGTNPIYVDGALNENVQIINLQNNASLLSSVKELLDGFKLEAELAIYVAEGSYDMGALIAEILSAAGVGLEGLDEVTSLYWDITSPFMLNIRLQLLIEYGTSDEDMRIALTLDTDGLRIDENNVINAGTLLGLYYNNGKALLDLTNFKIAGITLPAYTIDIELFDLVDGMITDLINGLDISAVSGDGAQDDAAVDEGQTGDIAGMNLANGDDELTTIDAIVLGISSEEIALRASFSAVATLLSTALSGNETVATVTNVLESLDLSLGASMKRDQDLTLTLSGMLNWAPLRTDTDASGEFVATTAQSSSVEYESSSTAGGETTLVYSFAPVAGASSYTALLTNADRSIRVEGTVENGKAYFTGADLSENSASSELYTVTVTGNITSPVNMQLSLGTAQLLGADQDAIKGELDGMLGTEDSAGSVNFAERVNAYGDLLLTGLIDTLLNTRISLALNLALIKDQLPAGGTVSLSDIVLAIAGDIVVSAGLTLDDILGSVDVVFDMDVTTIILDVAMNMDLDNPWNTDLLVQLRSDIGGVQDVLLGLYVYDNLLTIDLRALGLRAYTLQNFDYIVNVQNMLKELLFGSEATGDSGLLGEYDIDLSETISGLLNPAEEPETPPATGDPGITDQPSADVPSTDVTTEVPSISITAKNDVTDPDNRTTTISWPAVEGVDHYEIKTVLQDGTTFVVQNIAATATSYTYTMIAGVYDVTVEAHLFDHTVIASGTRQMNGAIASILSAVSLQNTIVKLKVTPQIINNLLAVIAPDISIKAEPIDVSASVDIFNGDASADVNVNLKYEQPVGDTTFRLGAELSIKTADTLYITDNTGVGEINEVLKELGSDVDTINFGSNVNDAGVDAARITYAILDALNTTDISANLNISFNKGTYDIGAMLSGMGIEALDGVSLLWTFDENQDIALKLELGMYVDIQGLTGTESLGTWFLLDITAQSEIRLGNVVVNNSDMGAPYVIENGAKIISIYGKEASGDSAGTVYVDLSSLSLLGLELPVISAQYKFTDLLINEFYNIICSIMDLNSYLEATYTVTTDEGGVPTTLTFGWDEVTLGDSAASPEVYYDVTVVGTMPNGMTSTIRTETIKTESTSFNYGDIEMFSQFDVTVVSYFLFNGERRVLGEYTTNVQLNNSNAIATASYVTPDDVYAEEDNAKLARVNNVKWTWTAAGTAQISWDAYEGATAYRIEIRRASDGAALQSTGSFAVPAENTSWTPETTFFLAKDSFDATHPMMGGSGEQVWDYGYIAEVYAYTDEELAEEDTLTTDILKGYSPAAVGAANSFADMNMWFAPKASEYGGATSTFHVGWGAVEGAANYSVLPYRINNAVSGGMTTTYPVVGLTQQGGAALSADNLMLEGDQLSFTYYNATYTREYFVEVVAYDKFGNMIARGEMTAAMGKLNDSDKTLLPVSTIALVLDSERFGLEVQLNAILAILEGVGVELPIDLRGFDVEAALGLDTTIGISGGNNIITIATDGEGEEDVDGFKLNGLTDGNYTLTMVYTNSGGVERTDSLSFTVASGEYTITSGDYSITDGFVNYGMRRNGTYKITLGGAATAEATFTVSRTLNLGITGNVTVPVSGAENSNNNFSIGVTNQTGTSTIGITNDGKTLFWDPTQGAATYTLHVVKTVNSQEVANETFEGLSSFIQQVDFTEAGVYTVTVTAFNAAGKAMNTSSATITVKGDSGLNISISVPYDDLAIGAADGQAALKSDITNRIEAVGNDNYDTVLEILQAYLGDFSLSLSLGIESFTTEINLQTIINSVLAAVGVTTEIGAPIYINTDDISAMGVTLDVSWHLDWGSPLESYASIELNYVSGEGGDQITNTMIGAYLENNIVCVDLTGVGLIGVKLSSEPLYRFLTSAITGAIEGLFDGLDMGEGLDLSTAIQMLLGEYPTINLAQITSGGSAASANAVQSMALAAADETASTEQAAGEEGGLDIATVLPMLLNAVSLNSTNIFVSATTAVLDTITSGLLGIKLGVDVDFELQVPLLSGNIIADLRLDNITFQAMLSITAMDQPAAPGVNSKNFATIDGSGTGAEAVMALLSNLPLNLTLELANSNMDTAAYKGYSPDTNWMGHASYPAGTRINVEVRTSAKTYGSDYQLQNAFTADAGDIVVTIATTNEAEQDSTGTGHLQYFLVVHIDISAGQISVKLCKRAIVLQAWAALGIIGEIDLGGGVSVFGSININIAAIPLNINIALDLASTLGDLLDGLLTTINGLGGASSNTDSAGSAGGNTSSGTGVTVDPYELAVSAVGNDENDAAQQGKPYEVHFNPIMNETAWNNSGVATAWEEAYDRYIITVSRPDGSIVKIVEQEARGYTEQNPARYTVPVEDEHGTTNYYESYTVTVTGESDPTGFSAALADIDIWKLLGGGLVRGSYDTSGNFTPSDSGNVVTTTGGIYFNLNSTGEMNLTVRFDPYEMNKAVDAIFGSIFGANSALDLTTASLGNGYFAINYLMFMWWDRANMSENRLIGNGEGNNEHSFVTNEQAHPTSTLDSLAANLRGLLADLLYQMNIAVNEAGATVSAATLRSHDDSLQWSKWDDSDWGLMPIMLSIFSKFVPISIWTSAELNVNMSNGVLTNISFMGNDDGSAVLRYNKDTGVNDVYVYYAKTLYNGNGGDYNWYMPGSGADTDYQYNPNSQDIGRQINGETLTIPYRATNTGGIVYQTMPVFTYAIPYGSVYGGDYDYTKVEVTPGTGANGGKEGYGGALASNGSSLYRRGGYDVNGNLVNDISGVTTVINRHSVESNLRSYTRIEIYNTGSEVNSTNAGLGNAYRGGIVSWGNLPNRIVFDQYSMGWNTQAGPYLMDTYFGNAYTARWQNGTSFARANVTFKLNGTDLNGSGVDGGQLLATALGRANESTGLIVTVVAEANFGSGRVATMDIEIEKCLINDTTSTDPWAHDGRDEYASVDEWNLYYYDELPEYIIMTTWRGERKRYKVVKSGSADARSGNYDAIISGYASDAAGYAQSDTEDATLTFKNGKKVRLTINYLDSSLVNPTVTVDMNNLQNEYDENGELVDVTAKISNAIQALLVNYADGSVLTNGSGISWGGESELTTDTIITGSRYIEDTDGRSITLGEWIKRFRKDTATNLKGDTFFIDIAVNVDTDMLKDAANAGAFTQNLTVVVDIPTKRPASISVHGSAADTVVLNPYDYYMYLVTGSDANNPLPGAVDVTYENGITESVSVMWRNKEGNFISAEEFVSNWYTVADSTKTFYLENDETRYSFRWTGYEMSVQINSGVIDTMQFLVDGEWVDSVPKGTVTTTARVTFTGGYVLELPAVIRESTGGYGYAYIGYDVAKYNATGALVEYAGCNFKQAKRIQLTQSSNQGEQQ